MPVYDYQRTLKPFADMVKGEIQDNRRIGLASDESRYIGIFAFYLDRNFSILNSPHEVARFLTTPGIPAAVIVKKADLVKINPLLPPGKVQILRSGHKGYHVDTFRLLMNRPFR
jgi:hypothetical protein